MILIYIQRYLINEIPCNELIQTPGGGYSCQLEGHDL